MPSWSRSPASPRPTGTTRSLGCRGCARASRSRANRLLRWDEVTSGRRFTPAPWASRSGGSRASSSIVRGYAHARRCESTRRRTTRRAHLAAPQHCCLRGYESAAASCCLLRARSFIPITSGIRSRSTSPSPISTPSLEAMARCSSRGCAPKSVSGRLRRVARPLHAFDRRRSWRPPIVARRATAPSSRPFFTAHRTLDDSALRAPQRSPDAISAKCRSGRRRRTLGPTGGRPVAIAGRPRSPKRAPFGLSKKPRARFFDDA